jgi:hypothetical protein
MPMFEKFMDMLEDCDDVQNIYHNVSLWEVGCLQMAPKYLVN